MDVPRGIILSEEIAHRENEEKGIISQREKKNKETEYIATEGNDLISRDGVLAEKTSP